MAIQRIGFTSEYRIPEYQETRYTRNVIIKHYVEKAVEHEESMT